MKKPFKYTKSQENFLIKLKEKGVSDKEIMLRFNARFKVKRSLFNIKDAFKKFRSEETLKVDTSKVLLDKKINNIKEKFLKFVETKKFVPTQAEFCRSSKIDKGTIKANFGSYSKLEKDVRKSSPEVFEDILDPHTLTNKKFNEVRKEVKSFRRYFISTAVTGCNPFTEGLASVATFCKAKKAKFLTLVCSDPAHTKDSKYNFKIHSDIPNESIIFRDFNLNSNLFISTIKMGAKQIKPLTGIESIAQKKGSLICASPQQDISHLTNKNKKSIPRAIMTTGAITLPNYNTELYLSDRTANIATENHVLGGIIVEVKDNKTFFYRPVQFDKNGAFSDLNYKYHPDGRVEEITAELVQWGDYHVGSTDPKAKEGGIELVKMTNPDYLTLEDFFDGITINPHTKTKFLLQAIKYLQGNHTLNDELGACSKELNEIGTLPIKKQIVLKYGNHEDFLLRWLNDGDYVKDKINKYLGTCLAKAVMEGNAPFEFAMRNIFSLKNPQKFTFLKVNDSFLVNNIENGAHGHLGISGKRNPTLDSVRKAYGASNVGHNHSGAKYKEVFRAGTKTYAQLDYNDGPSAWTHSDVLQHRDGSRQLITHINGEFYLKD